LRGADDLVKTTKLITAFPVALLAALSAQAQSAFTNLNFESATLSPVPPGPPSTYVPVSNALPGWSVHLGNTPQTQVVQNDLFFGTASVDIFGPNYPAAEPPPKGDPGIIDGNFSVLLQAGADPATHALEAASIAQYGTVPPGSQSLEFKAWMTSFTEFSVSFDGNNLSPVALGNGANYTLYGVNISSYAGDPGTLDFSALFSGAGASWLGLDDITFSQNVVTPEPSIVTLTAIGGLLFGVRKWFARRC